jgi:predicted protein tyrosine phosphatase
MIRRTETILTDMRIGTILNVSAEVQAKPEHRALYKRLGIRYVELPIEDSVEKTPPRDFIQQVLAVYAGHEDPSRAFIINCSMGVNRSSFAAGAILWSSAPNPRPWSSPEDMIAYMRQVQREDRGVFLLTNALFESELLQWCRGGVPNIEERPIAS